MCIRDRACSQTPVQKLPVAGSCPPELVSSVPSECHCWNPQSIPVTPSGAVKANFQYPMIDPCALGALKFGNAVTSALAARPCCAALIPPANCANALARTALEAVSKLEA